ncbi:MAG: FHA domain-containing protein [Nitrospirae bacterium YQR-1]
MGEEKKKPFNRDETKIYQYYSQKGDSSTQKESASASEVQKNSYDSLLTTKSLTDITNYVTLTDKSSLVGGTPHPLYGWIVGISSTNNDRDYQLFEGKNTIGRISGNSIVLHDSTVSKEHCAIICHKGEILIVDNNSTNGVFVNNKRIYGPTLLKDGYLLFIGDVAFQMVFYKRLYSRAGKEA